MQTSGEMGSARVRRGRWHSPSIALFAGLILPGAGQAYNGHPFRAGFVLLSAPFLLPWVAGSLLARRRARQMVEAGGRYGKGGFFWILLHAWLAVNLVLLVAFILTWEGVLA